jgi:predicted AlkP superfamily phosphohydrolase/phosphomutase
VKNSRTVIIGLDGVPFGMLREFADSGVMPNTGKLISQGVFKKMDSSIPEISSVAWSSMITGSNPGQHGIFGFMDLQPNSYKLKFPNFNDLKVSPFWEQWEGKFVIINVPSTYPVRRMNGVLISGFVSIEFEKSVYPASLIPQLKRMDYRLDVDTQKAHSDMGAFLNDLDKTLAAEIEAYRWLWDNQDWRNFMLVFTTTDRLMHFLWDAYEDKNHKYHQFFLDHYNKIDKAIGEIAGRISDDDLFIMHSDHGFERLEKDVYVNYFLVENGFLQFKQGEDISIGSICFGAKAFALDPARIYLNLKGKYPCGSVEAGEIEQLLCELGKLFGSLEIDGKKVMRDIYRKEQIYSGPCVGDGPDMVLVGAEGFNLKANVKTSKLFDKGVFTGKHTQDTAFLLLKGLSDETIIPEVPAVSDIKQIAEKNKCESKA